jgi:hypothetical protein
MALRNRIPDNEATYPDPIFGINLSASPEDVQRGECLKMINCIYDNGVITRPGSSRIKADQIEASARTRGGHKFYYSTGSKRLMAYSTKVSTVTDAGTVAELKTDHTEGDTFFTTWTITDKVYIANYADELYEYDGTTYQAVSANASDVNVPGKSGVGSPAKMVVPLLDRLFAITENGLERTDPRVAHIWSQDSSWATLRPSQAGQFTAAVPWTMGSQTTGIVSGLLVFQASAYYFVQGTNFGDDVTSATASTGEDASIRLIDASVGTSSPYSLTQVPGVGLFFVTSDLNVYFIPQGASQGVLVGTRIVSKDTDFATGLESANVNQLSQIWMGYQDQILSVGFPTDSNAYSSVQYYMDMKRFTGNNTPVWYGPHSGQTLGRVWPEQQSGENRLVAGEGNATTGVFLYQIQQAAQKTDAVGTSDNAISTEYHTYLKTFGAPSREKLIQTIEMETNAYAGTLTVDVRDLDQTIATALPVEDVI